MDDGMVIIHPSCSDYIGLSKEISFRSGLRAAQEEEPAPDLVAGQ
jgi:hypothetical protein